MRLAGIATTRDALPAALERSLRARLLTRIGKPLDDQPRRSALVLRKPAH